MSATRRLLLLGSTAAGLARRGAMAQPQEHPDGATPAPAAEADAPQRSPAPREAYVYIGWPQDGQVINGTRFKVWFGTRNFGVAPAGVSKPNTGHHHIIIDAPLPPL